MTVVTVSSLTVSISLRFYSASCLSCLWQIPITPQPPWFYSPKIFGGQYIHEGYDTVTNKMHNAAIKSFATETLKARQLSILQEIFLRRKQRSNVHKISVRVTWWHLMGMDILEHTAGAETWRYIPYDKNIINNKYGLQLLWKLTKYKEYKLYITQLTNVYTSVHNIQAAKG
jgi:hypothetical protein